MTAVKRSDAALNDTYQRALARAPESSAFRQSLRKAERSWLAFRDAELDARFPLEDGESYRSVYGSSWEACFALAQLELNRKRIAELRPWAEGVPESMCAGSYPFRAEEKRRGVDE